MKSIAKWMLLASLSLCPAMARADAIWIGVKNPIMAGGVHILRIESNSLIYSAGTDTEINKPLDQIQQISADGETDFNAAEQAYRDGKWAVAADAYQKAIRSSHIEWVRDRASIRLAEVSGKVNRFDLAATAYVGLLVKDSTLAAKAKPTLSDAAAPYYDGAIADIKRTLDNSKLTDIQRGGLLTFLLEIQRAKKDTAGANQTVAELIKLGVASPSEVAMAKLASARSALDGKDFARAQAEIQQNRRLFNDPAQQTDAFFILAKAREGANGTGTDPQTLRDIAVSYMRVVAAGKDLQNQPHVGESLLRVAQIEEQLKEPKTAVQLYQQITRDYNDQLIVGQAKAALDRLAAKGT